MKETFKFGLQALKNEYLTFRSDIANTLKKLLPDNNDIRHFFSERHGIELRDEITKYLADREFKDVRSWDHKPATIEFGSKEGAHAIKSLFDTHAEAVDAFLFEEFKIHIIFSVKGNYLSVQIIDHE